MTHAFAIAYDWLYDTWSPEQRAVLAQAMEMGSSPACRPTRAPRNSAGG